MIMCVAATFFCLYSVVSLKMVQFKPKSLTMYTEHFRQAASTDGGNSKQPGGATKGFLYRYKEITSTITKKAIFSVSTVKLAVIVFFPNEFTRNDYRYCREPGSCDKGQYKSEPGGTQFGLQQQHGDAERCHTKSGQTTRLGGRVRPLKKQGNKAWRVQ